MVAKTYVVTVTDPDGNSGTGEVVIGTNDAPTISSITVTPSSAPSGTQRTLKVVASDPDGDPLEVKMFSDTGAEVPITPVAGQPGSYNFTA